MSDLIFGRTWEEIQAAQQGKQISKPVPPVDPVKMKAQIEADIVKFGLPVYKDVAELLGVTIPEHYELVGEKYQPKCPT